VLEILDRLDPSPRRVRPLVGAEQLDDHLGGLLQEPVLDLLDHLGARIRGGGRRPRPGVDVTIFKIFKIFDGKMRQNFGNFG
jgi:hypothetical protein